MVDIILMIDKDISESRKLKIELENKEFGVFICTNIEEALFIINANNIDSILVFNVNLNVQKLRDNAISSKIPIIGMVDISQKEKIEELSYDDYIFIPYDKKEVINKLNCYIKIKKLQDKLIQKDEEIAKLSKKMNDLSLIDKETGIYNEFYLKQILTREFSKAVRFKYNLSGLIFSIDNKLESSEEFAKIFKQMARIIEEIIRKSDIFVRLNKNEFYILLPSTSLKDALFVAEKLRKKINQTQFSSEKNITISVGVTIFDEIERGIKKEEEMIMRARESMLAAIEKGGNIVEYR